MVNKGKGCISAIFNGSIPIGVIKHGLETVFQKPSEPVEPSPIPGYTVLDSIYADGSQYAIIDYYANQNTKVEMQFSYVKNSSYAGCLYASRTAYQNSAFAFMPYVSETSKTRSSFGAENKEFTLISANTVHKVVQEGIYTYVDDELKATHTNTTFTASNPMHILTQPGAVTTRLGARIYYMKIWDNGELVHDLVPALNDETGIAGLYDMVNKEFITSETDTEFIPVYTASKYVSDGLYANYTGLNSTGSTWLDMANGRNLTLYANPTYNADKLRYEFRTGTRQYAQGNVTAPSDDVTIEVYGSFPSISSNSFMPVFFSTIYGYSKGYGLLPRLLSGDTRYGAFVAPSTGNQKSAILDGLDNIVGVDVKTKFVFTRNSTTGVVKLYVKNVNGSASNETTLDTGAISGVTQLTVGSQKPSNSTTSTDHRTCNIHAIRIYDRVLTNTEIAQNHAEDVRIYGE